MSIESRWKLYFENADEGLGSTYDRIILHRYFGRLDKCYAIESVLETPSLGMTGVSGINSVWWAKKGKSVALTDDNLERIQMIKKMWKHVSLDANIVHSKYADDLPFENKSFDLSWNYASLRFVPNLKNFCKEMARVTRKVIFLSVDNKLGLANLLFRSKSSKDTRDPEPAPIIAEMKEVGWKLKEGGYLDVPPWPDTKMGKEELLQKIGLGMLCRLREKPARMTPWIFDAFNGKDPELEKRLLRLTFLEDLPGPLKMFWAHHRYLIFTP
jgi:hypothetical protein